MTDILLFLESEFILYLTGVFLLVVLINKCLTYHEEPKVIAHLEHPVWNLVKHSKPFSEGYSPTFWLCFGTKFFSGSIQTVVHTLVRHLRQQPVVEYDREMFKLSDGGTVGLDWVMSSIDPKTSEIYQAPKRTDERYPIVFLHHGLCGSSTSQYILSLVNCLLRTQKYRVVVLVARGCGNVPLSTPEGFIAARTLDMRESLSHIFEKNPRSMVYGMGFSLGAGIMAKYIGEEGDKCKLAGAVVISPCWDFLKRSPWFKIWSKSFLAASLIEYTKSNIEMFKKNVMIDLDSALDADCVEIYDKHIVIPTQGYKDVQEYYKKSSPLAFAHNITIPTLSVNSADDPVCSISGCPETRGKIGPGLVIVKTKRGGHVCWPKGLDSHTSWMDEVIMSWINGCHDFQLSTVSKARKNLTLNDNVEIQTFEVELEVKTEPEVVSSKPWYENINISNKKLEGIGQMVIAYVIFRGFAEGLTLLKKYIAFMAYLISKRRN